MKEEIIRIKTKRKVIKGEKCFAFKRLVNIKLSKRQ